MKLTNKEKELLKFYGIAEKSITSTSDLSLIELMALLTKIILKRP